MELLGTFFLVIAGWAYLTGYFLSNDHDATLDPSYTSPEDYFSGGTQTEDDNA